MTVSYLEHGHETEPKNGECIDRIGRKGWSDCTSGHKGGLYAGKGDDNYWAGEAELVR